MSEVTCEYPFVELNGGIVQTTTEFWSRNVQMLSAEEKTSVCGAEPNPLDDADRDCHTVPSEFSV